VRGASWPEIDLPAAVWTIPPSRMKAGKEHRVPLSDAALAVLHEAAKLRQGEGSDGLVFPAIPVAKPLSNTALFKLLCRMRRRDITTHGFRSTFRDWASETTAYPREVCEAALAHAVGDRVEAAYRRGDLFEKRRRLMDEWAVFCARPTTAGGQVVPMRATAG
jgi:integrase